MKRRLFSFLLALVLLSVLSQTAFADDTMDALTSFGYCSQGGIVAFETYYPDIEGKALIAVYYDDFDHSLATSMQAAQDGTDFYGIPAAFLAKSIEDAAWALVVVPMYTDDGSAVWAGVFAVDLSTITYYEPYGTYEQNTVIILPNGKGEWDITESLEAINEEFFAPRHAQTYISPAERDYEYDLGLEYMEQGLYFSAYELFIESGTRGADELAESCILPWPKNGEVWRAEGIGAGDMELTIDVNQPDDTAYFARLYLDGTHVSDLFVGGTGSATVRLPGGNYTIKDGSGKTYYGVREMFGRYASYETLEYDEEGTTVANLQKGHGYVLSINITQSERDPEAKDVFSSGEDFDNMVE